MQGQNCRPVHSPQQGSSCVLPLQRDDPPVRTHLLKNYTSVPLTMSLLLPATVSVITNVIWSSKTKSYSCCWRMKWAHVLIYIQEHGKIQYMHVHHSQMCMQFTCMYTTHKLAFTDHRLTQHKSIHACKLPYVYMYILICEDEIYTIHSFGCVNSPMVTTNGGIDHVNWFVN